jgi:hypothetical protein
MKLLSAVLFLGKSKLETVVQDGQGGVRRILINWKSRLGSNIPPSNLIDILDREVGVQQGDELNAKKGRKLPR